MEWLAAALIQDSIFSVIFIVSIVCLFGFATYKTRFNYLKRIQKINESDAPKDKFFR